MLISPGRLQLGQGQCTAPRITAAVRKTPGAQIDALIRWPLAQAERNFPSIRILANHRAWHGVSHTLPEGQSIVPMDQQLLHLGGLENARGGTVGWIVGAEAIATFTDSIFGIWRIKSTGSAIVRRYRTEVVPAGTSMDTGIKAGRDTRKVEEVASSPAPGMKSNWAVGIERVDGITENNILTTTIFRKNQRL